MQLFGRKFFSFKFRFLKSCFSFPWCCCGSLARTLRRRFFCGRFLRGSFPYRRFLRRLLGCKRRTFRRSLCTLCLRFLSCRSLLPWGHSLFSDVMDYRLFVDKNTIKFRIISCADRDKFCLWIELRITHCLINYNTTIST